MAEIDLAPLPGEPVPTPGPHVPLLRPATAEGDEPTGKLKRFKKWWEKFPSTPALWALLLIFTGVGAFLRYWRLDYQAYWTDEAHTLDRIQGNYQNMLHDVGNQLFTPGWYSLLRWWVELWQQHFAAHGMTMAEAGGLAYEPNITRALTAFFGTLMVPAMYFLARQFTDRKGALLVMLLTAVNPFLIYYARDIKMYAPFLFFVALNSAIFFKWMTSQKHVLWLPLYVLTGFCMMTSDFLGGFLLGFHLIFLLTRPRPRSWDAALWAIAVGLIVWFPVYWKMNYVSDQQVQQALEQDEDVHLGWIVRYTDMDWHTVQGLPTAHVLGYLWPEYPVTDKMKEWFYLGNDFDDHLQTRSWPWMAKWQLYAAYALYGVLLLGLLPWRGFRKDPERLTSSTRGRWWWLAIWIGVPVVYFAGTWISQDSNLYDYWWDLWVGILHHDKVPKRIWEPRYMGFIVPAWLLWLAASCRRLPFWPIRTVVILFFVGVCTFSSLSNHLIYRNAPFQRVAATVMRYYDPKLRNAMVVEVPVVAYPSPAEQASMDAARKIIPYSAGEGQPFSWSQGASWASALNFVNSEKNVNQVKTIMLVDRDGDDAYPQISNSELAMRLGSQWKLVDEEKFEWHYEWRFYIFHTWRIRVWQRQAPPATSPK